VRQTKVSQCENRAIKIVRICLPHMSSQVSLILLN